MQSPTPARFCRRVLCNHQNGAEELELITTLSKRLNEQYVVQVTTREVEAIVYY